jgi:hypothetical protein
MFVHTPLQQYEPLVQERPAECVPPPMAQQVLLLKLQLLLQQSEFCLQWSPILGAHMPPELLPPPLPPKPLLLPLPDGGFEHALDWST